ncbi:hypothetical protein [Sporolactobacillus putidus]|uniref:DUF3953 domain-containing protein n=1 Tax=Sporolactobacillus putidus TaxID=492735 RepID=A0A917S5H1_9BACL|nr:hypothetical protein [Sporolactobacillus putidus]GGL54790.1 hypothetical protein GCM10007968_18560 [Sporolactobacillus putidus]
MLRLLRIVSALIATAIGLFAIITNKIEWLPFMNLFLGAMFAFSGMSEWLEKKKGIALFSMILSGFALLSALYFLIK